MKSVSLVSLGCPKNLVDSEVMLGMLARDGYTYTPNPEEAGLIVVNTCGFIGPSQKESIDAILDMAERKKAGILAGRKPKLVVTGCLVQRYPGELQETLPEVDLFVGTGEFQNLPEMLGDDARREVVGRPEYVYDSITPRMLTTKSAMAYIKISEGCDHKCTFCIIPTLRGLARSRSIEDIAAEARSLAEQGVRELVLVSQDATAYGRDLENPVTLGKLLRHLDNVPGIRWVRVMYQYPKLFDDELIDVLAHGKRVLPYIDMPLQHISDPVLRAMRRGTREKQTRDLIVRLREQIPNLIFRTTFIVGFPGETDEDFEKLNAFVAEGHFDRVGVFRYCKEDGTPAGEMGEQIPEKVKTQRYRKLMKTQQAISLRRNEALVGKQFDVLVEGYSEETDLLLKGRFYGQAPDIDGVVLINDGDAAPGQFHRVEITEAHPYDIVGRIVSPCIDEHATLP
jgi:ribosomal protein S12 methylthiotransferase